MTLGELLPLIDTPRINLEIRRITPHNTSVNVLPGNKFSTEFTPFYDKKVQSVSAVFGLDSSAYSVHAIMRIVV